MATTKSPTSSPPPPISSTESSPKASHSRTSTSISAAIAAALDATRAHQTLFPGLATLFFEGSTSISAKYASLELESFDGSTFLPSVETVHNAALKSINDYPPYVTMNVRDSAPQLQLEDGTSLEHSKDYNTDEGIDFSKTIRRLVVRGKMRGYRMSRASHGVGSGCYYYEAIVLDSRECCGGGQKRMRVDTRENMESTANNAAKDAGHVRLGWSTRMGDLQAPVGYDKHSFAVRDIMGSRIHNSRREDKWGGLAFGPGDVIGFVICLEENASSDGAATDNTSKEGEGLQSNHIRVYKNGVLMGSQTLAGDEKASGIAFENIPLDTYFPAVSCYLDAAVQLNFGPNFIYPVETLPNGVKPKPISNACAPPPTPEEAEETIISSSKEGRKIFLSKRTDEGIVTTFKQLVRTEAMVRREAYLRHLLLHKVEILGLRNERRLPTDDLVVASD